MDMTTSTKMLKVKIMYNGASCGDMGIKDGVCSYFVYLADPQAGGNFIGMCGLFKRYLMTIAPTGGRPRRCHDCVKKFKD